MAPSLGLVVSGAPLEGTRTAGDCLLWGVKLLGSTHKESGEQRCQRASKDLILSGLARGCHTCLGRGSRVCVRVCMCVYSVYRCVHVHTSVCMCMRTCGEREREERRVGETETDRGRERLRDVRSFS